jgi:radical S-adenosyl methionine domain-containing protein 2
VPTAEHYSENKFGNQSVSSNQKDISPEAKTYYRHNWQEDMNSSIEEIAPVRWKVRMETLDIFLKSSVHLLAAQVFQVLLLDGENTGSGTGSLRDARELVITDEQFQAFLDRHKDQPSLVPESNEVMKDSYLLLDEEMRYVVIFFSILVPMMID